MTPYYTVVRDVAPINACNADLPGTLWLSLQSIDSSVVFSELRRDSTSNHTFNSTFWTWQFTKKTYPSGDLLVYQIQQRNISYQNIHLNFFDILILIAISTSPSSYGHSFIRRGIHKRSPDGHVFLWTVTCSGYFCCRNARVKSVKVVSDILQYLARGLRQRALP